MHDYRRWRRPPAIAAQRVLFATNTPPDTPAATLPHNGSPTSRAAAERAAARAPSQVDRIMAYIHERGEVGATIDELVEALDILSQSASARVNGMRRDGLLRDSGKTRVTRSGCAAIVWIASHLSASSHSGGRFA